MLVTSQSNATGSLEVDASGSIHGAPYRGMLAKRHSMTWIARDQLAFSGVSNLCADHFAFVAFDKPAIVICQRGKSTPLFTCPMQELCSCLASDSTFIYSGTKKGNIYVHQVRTGELVAVWQAHLKGIVKLITSKDSQFLFSAGEDGLLKAWNLCLILDTNLAAINSFGSKVSKGTNSRMFTPFRSWNAHTLPITDMVMILDTSPTIRIATSSFDRTIAIFDISCDAAILRVATGKEISTLACTLHKDHVVAGSNDGFLLFIPFANVFNSIQIQSLVSFELIANHSPIRVITMSPDGITCLIASNGSKIRRFHLYTKTVLGDIDLSQSSHSNHALDDISNILIASQILNNASTQHQQQLAGSQLVPLRKYPETGESNSSGGNSSSKGSAEVVFGPTIIGSDQDTLRYLYEHHHASSSSSDIMAAKNIEEGESQLQHVSSNKRFKQSSDETKEDQQLGDFLLLPAASSLPTFNNSSNNDDGDEMQETESESMSALQRRIADLEAENQRWKQLCQQQTMTQSSSSSNEKSKDKKRSLSSDIVNNQDEDNDGEEEVEDALEAQEECNKPKEKKNKSKKHKKQKGPAKTLRALY